MDRGIDIYGCVPLQVIVEKFGQVARFGFMHLVATNVAIWIRMVVWESATDSIEVMYSDSKFFFQFAFLFLRLVSLFLMMEVFFTVFMNHFLLRSIFCLFILQRFCCCDSPWCYCSSLWFMLISVMYYVKHNGKSFSKVHSPKQSKENDNSNDNN